MRSSLDGRIAGIGAFLAFVEYEETYFDKKIKPSDILFPRHSENMNGECVPYTMTQEELNTYFSRK